MNLDMAITDVKARLDIVDIVGEYVELKRSAGSFTGLCPFHNDTKPSFSVCPTRQYAKCFSCGAGGDIIAFIEKVEGLSFIEALKHLANRAGVTIEERQESPSQRTARSEGDRERRTLIRVNELAQAFFQESLWMADGADSLAYLRDRGFKDETIRDWGLGYAPPKFGAFRTYLKSQLKDPGKVRLATDAAVRASIMKQQDNHKDRPPFERYRNRITFPIHNHTRGELISFIARRAPGNESGGKYINGAETELFKKNAVLYGLDRAAQSIRKAGRVIIVEGNPDVVICHQSGFTNAVATLGTAFTQHHATIIKRYTDSALFWIDADQAGDDAIIESIKTCYATGLECKVMNNRVDEGDK